MQYSAWDFVIKNITNKPYGMKKNIILFFLSFVLMVGVGRAQTPMTIPNGSFEQWTDNPGYSVTVFFVPVEVYGDFSTPSVWNFPSYPVNENISLMGMNVNINTDVPIVKASRETGTVPDGNTAVKLETFLLEDIVNPTVLSLAGSYIDSSLTQQVIPSILSTGAFDIDAFIPLISNLMSGSGDIYSLLPILLTEDVNDYITGGLPLDGFRPGRLTGSYKYHSATSGDNGGVMMLGTRYNTVTHKREVVGGGINIGLTDVNVFTPFEVEYQPLGALVPGSPNRKPDSLIVLLFSSAGTNMQRGSYLCLDNLELWPAPDTCASILEIALTNQVLTWVGSSQPDRWQVEYGPQGFQYGSGTVVETEQSHFEIAELVATGVLSPDTWYDFYVRSVCDDSIYGDWDSVQYHTPSVEGINEAFNPQLAISPNPANGQCTVTFSDNEPAELKLYSIDGRLRQSVSTSGTLTELTLPETGIFLLQATTPSGTVTSKIVNR